MTTMFGARHANGSTEGRTGSAANVDAETIDNADPESTSVPLISAPLRRSGTSNCCAPPSVGRMAPQTYVRRYDCSGRGRCWSSVIGSS